LTNVLQARINIESARVQDLDKRYERSKKWRTAQFIGGFSLGAVIMVAVIKLSVSVMSAGN